jgi:2-keto-myo-inositol isomerase
MDEGRRLAANTRHGREVVAGLQIALNRMVAPNLPLDEFLGLARRVGASGVEIRNDVEGQEFADGMAAGELKVRVADAGLQIASINALQRVNDWTREREKESVYLARYAEACGAPAMVLCPVIDANDERSPTELARDLRNALRQLKPILADCGVTGLVEPLGMVDSTLRHQRPAKEAIDDVAGWDVFGLCYDTFQHYRSYDTDTYPERTGMIHISGTANAESERERLAESDRGFVNDSDIVGNVGQVAALFRGGYSGFVSFEPFDPAIHSMASPEVPLRRSRDYVLGAVGDLLAA